MASKYMKLADIPTNFDIGKYSVCSEWNLGTWAANLARRTLIRSQVGEALVSGDGGDYLKMMRHMCSELFDDPLLSDSYDREGPLGMNDEPWSAHASRVRDLNCIEYLRAHEHFDDDQCKPFTEKYYKAVGARYPFVPFMEGPDESEEAHAAFDELQSTPEWRMLQEIPPPFEPFPDAWKVDPVATVRVDLSAADDELVEDFKAWLEHARQTRQIQPATGAISASDMQQWTKMRVLAFIDLSLWLEANEKKATLTVVGRALFPDEFDIGLEDRVRKVVADYAETLMTPSAIRSMQSQYLKAEREKEKTVPELRAD
ncbi:hypothetical protein AWB71_00692 [Caballeronia peredens]|nr:hypothetical protein AWB71_00692 [Caballeronia peredens]